MTIYWNMVIINLFILIIWFKTDAFIEYSKLFKLSYWFFVDDFEKKRSEDFELTYHLYLRQYRDGFFTRLVTCPICLTSWLLIIILLVERSLATFSLNVIVTLSLYYLFSKLMR